MRVFGRTVVCPRRTLAVVRIPANEVPSGTSPFQLIRRSARVRAAAAALGPKTKALARAALESSPSLAKDK